MTDSCADECTLAVEALIKTYKFDGSIKNKQEVLLESCGQMGENRMQLNENFKNELPPSLYAWQAIQDDI